jgi:hypothetical protein
VAGHSRFGEARPPRLWQRGSFPKIAGFSAMLFIVIGIAVARRAAESRQKASEKPEHD